MRRPQPAAHHLPNGYLIIFGFLKKTTWMATDKGN